VKHKLGKFFWEYKGENRILKTFDYDPTKNIEYYEYVKQYHQSGYHQLILTSDLILNLVSYYFLERHLSISKIEFLEDDNALNEKIGILIKNCQIDRGYFAELINELNFISEETSIDIKRVNLINQFDNKKPPKSLFFQVNGIVGVDTENYQEELKSIIDRLQG